MTTERERKFELDAGRPVPRLAGTGPVTAQRDPVERVLEATYFDTPGHHLLAAGITLRRRLGGADPGWHLKLPVAPDTREEVRLPPGGDANRVPGRLRRLVTAYLAGEPLAPVAHIKTVRFEQDLVDADGRVLATLADDHVTGEAGGAVAHLDSWREIEVELGEDTRAGLLDDLARALRKAGARKSRDSSKIGRLIGPAGPAPEPSGGIAGYLVEQVDAVRRNDIRVRRDEPDAVHRMRVATRRLRSALRSFGPRETRGVARELRWLSRRLAPLRDTEVLYARMDSQLGDVPRELVLGEIRAFLTRQQAHDAAEARARAMTTLEGKRYAALLRDLARLRENLPSPATKPKKALRKARRKLHRAEQAVHAAPDLDAALHDVRKKAKRARYAIEALPSPGKKDRKRRKHFKAIQRVLGEHQDTVVTRQELRRLAVIAYGEGGNAFTYGLLHARNAAAAATLRHDYEKLVKD